MSILSRNSDDVQEHLDGLAPGVQYKHQQDDATLLGSCDAAPSAEIYSGTQAGRVDQTRRNFSSATAHRARSALFLTQAAVAGNIRELRHAGCCMHTTSVPSAAALHPVIAARPRAAGGGRAEALVPLTRAVLLLLLPPDSMRAGNVSGCTRNIAVEQHVLGTARRVNQRNRQSIGSSLEGVDSAAPL